MKNKKKEGKKERDVHVFVVLHNLAFYSLFIQGSENTQTNNSLNNIILDAKFDSACEKFVREVSSVEDDQHSITIINSSRSHSFDPNPGHDTANQES